MLVCLGGDKPKESCSLKHSFVCTYCDHKFQLYDGLWVNDCNKCPRCKETNIKPIKTVDGKMNVFGYPEDEKEASFDDVYFPGTD